VSEYGFAGCLKAARPDLLASRHRPRVLLQVAGYWLLWLLASSAAA
jgi:hypothetical protein